MTHLERLRAMRLQATPAFDATVTSGPSSGLEGELASQDERSQPAAMDSVSEREWRSTDVPEPQVEADLATDRLEPSAANRPLKVLISAYSCTPGAGSERGIGWNTAREMARRHEVWVITRPGELHERRQDELIAEELAANPVPSLHFIFYDLPAWMQRLFGIQICSYLWQLGLYRVARKAHEKIGFDLAHHVSWVRYYTPSLLVFLRIPFVWGPIGGGDAMPRSFRQRLRLRARFSELERRLLGFVATIDPLVRLTARRSTVTLANSVETANRVSSLGADRVRIFGESGVDRWVFEKANEAPPAPPERVTFASMTRLLHWKGVNLGLEAFARLENSDAVYWVIGDGPEEPLLRSLVRELGIADRVEFLPHLSRDEWMRRLRSCDALVHPCIYNSGSAISLEAMAMGRPVICLDRGGIRSQVSEDVGFRVSGDNPEEAIRGIRDAMQAIVESRELAAARGALARERVRRHFSWEARGLEMDRVYAYALSAASPREAATEAGHQPSTISRKS